MKRGTDCFVHVHKSNVPLNDHHMWPKEFGGPTEAWNLKRVCMNAHGDVHYYIDLLLAHKGDVPGNVVRTFSVRVRRLAEDGHDLILTHKKAELLTIRAIAHQRLEDDGYAVVSR